MDHATATNNVLIDVTRAPVYVVTINRAHVRNAVDRPTARALHAAFVAFANDDRFSVAILRGAGQTFCAGADLTAAFDNLQTVQRSGRQGSDPAGEQQDRSNDLSTDMDLPGPMGPSRMALPKPVIACIEGYALAGGLELAAWCDLRVASQSAKLGLPCRTRGVPLIDGGTIRLPALLGHSRAMDLILTGRTISATEAEHMGLVNVMVPDGSPAAPDATMLACLQLAELIASKPQLCMRHDRLSAMGVPLASQSTKPSAPAASTDDTILPCPYAVQGQMREAMAREFEHGLTSLTALGPALEEFIRRPRQHSAGSGPGSGSKL